MYGLCLLPTKIIFYSVVSFHSLFCYKVIFLRFTVIVGSVMYERCCRLNVKIYLDREEADGHSHVSWYRWPQWRGNEGSALHRSRYCQKPLPRHHRETETDTKQSNSNRLTNNMFGRERFHHGHNVRTVSGWLLGRNRLAVSPFPVRFIYPIKHNWSWSESWQK